MFFCFFFKKIVGLLKFVDLVVCKYQADPNIFYFAVQCHQ